MTGRDYIWNADGEVSGINDKLRGCLVFSYDRSGWLTGSMGQREQRRTTFVWERFRLLQETTWQGKRTYLYYAEQPYTPVAAVTGRGESRKIWYYHTDLTGTVQEVTASDGTLVWAGYQAGFGENRGDISNSGAYFEQPLRLPGQYFDEETGLHYNLFRYYAPECGRFISQDPIGLRGGLNLYAYAPNPLSWIDPLGLTPCANGGNAKKHGGTGHNNFIDNLIADARSQGATNIRKNQWQVDVNGNVVGKNRPDVQFDLNGKHYNIEVDTTIKGSVGHQNTIPILDPNSRNTFWLIDDLGNILNGHSII